MNLTKVFRVVGFLEGLTYLLLLFVAVPLKWLGGHPEGVKALGMPHGLLFISYVILAVNLASDQQWPKPKLRSALLAAILPLGTILFDRKHFGKK